MVESQRHGSSSSFVRNTAQSMCICGRHRTKLSLYAQVLLSDYADDVLCVIWESSPSNNAYCRCSESLWHMGQDSLALRPEVFFRHLATPVTLGTGVEVSGTKPVSKCLGCPKCLGTKVSGYHGHDGNYSAQCTFYH